MFIIKLVAVALWGLFIGLILYYFFQLFRRYKAHRLLHEEYIGQCALVEAEGKELPPEVTPPKGFFHALISSRTFWMLTFWMITTSGFMMFIVEESCQVLGFGRYGLQSSRLWPEAADAANYSADFIQSSDKLIDVMAIFNPIAGYVFGRYIDAEEKKLQWEMQRIEAELKKLNKRMVKVENELHIRPIAPDLITVKASGPPKKMPDPPKMRYPKQVDYETQAQRVSRQKGMVWKTSSGSKYHRFNCRWLRAKGQVEVRSSAEEISREEAIKEGLTPCGTCKPK